MDRTTKAILALIAAGLWMNIITGLIRPAEAQFEWVSRIGVDTKAIAQDMHVLLSGGPACRNKKICD